MATKYRDPMTFQNDMMLVGRLKSDSSKKVWVDIPDVLHRPTVMYFYVNAERTTIQRDLSEVDEDTMPLQLWLDVKKHGKHSFGHLYAVGSSSQGAAEDLLTAADKSMLARFDTPKQTMTDLDYQAVSEVMSKKHQLGWEPSVKMLKRARADAALYDTVPSKDDELMFFMAVDVDGGPRGQGSAQ